jgi:putative endonuclease
MREHSYATYIMSSKTGVLYIGVTNDLPYRVWQHKTGAVEGFTKKYLCHGLVYYERYQFVQSAIAREKELKGWTRAKKIALIESVNPRWRDLSEAWGKQFLMQGQSMKETDEASARRIKLGTKEQWLPKPHD